MNAHVLIIRLLLDSPLARAWSNLLPSRLRVEVSEADANVLDVQPIHSRDLPRKTEDIATERWRLTYETRQGRILRLAFSEERPSPRTHFEELRDACETISIFAGKVLEQEPYHFGLFLGAKVLVEELRRREAVLKQALMPPYPLSLV
jgi:hypothetical protein